MQFLVAFMPDPTLLPVETPQVHLLDQLFMPVEVLTRGDSTGAVLGPVVHARCYADTCGDSTGAVLGPVVYARFCADTCGKSQVQFSYKDSDVPVFNDTCPGAVQTVAVLGQGYGRARYFNVTSSLGQGC